MRTPKIADHLAAIARALERLGVRWYVFGAQAVVAAGAVRQTADIDITVEDVPVTALEKALAGAGFVRRRGLEGIEELIRHHRILPLEHRTSGLPLDVVRAGAGLEEAFLDRVIRRRVGRRLVPFVDTNDLVVLKILAGRPKDLEDVRALLRARSPEIDVAIIRARLGELARLLDDSSILATFERQRENVRRTRRTKR